MTAAIVWLATLATAEVPAPAAVPASPVEAPAEVAACDDDGRRASAATLARAQELLEALEYHEVVPLAQQVSSGCADAGTRVGAYWLLGQALSIIGDTVEAEKPLRLLLRASPDFALPPTAPPKVAAVFRKVEVEEKAIAQQLRELERQETLRQLAIEGALPPSLAGGEPIDFQVRLRDRGGAVETLRVFYRRRGELSYASLPLRAAADGRWSASVAGEWSASDAGFVLEYYLASAGRDGTPLLGVGDAGAPRTAQVLAGAVPSPPFYTSPWLSIASGVAAIAIGITAALVYDDAVRLPANDGRVELP